MLTLAPLRVRDVLIAASQLLVDGQMFLDHMQDKGLLAFAARPVTLTSLIQDCRDGVIPDNKVEIYQSMCDRLAHELNPDVFEATSAKPVVGQAPITVAGRLAALSEFSGRPVLWAGHDPAEREPLELDVQEAETSAALPAAGIDRAVVTRAVNTGLFETVGRYRFRFAHRSYGEFLAAAHAHDRGISNADLLGMIRDPASGLVFPQLAEVAAWIAAFRPAIYGLLVDTEPELLVNSDVATRSGDDRARLAEAILRRQDQVPPPRIDSGSLARLRHPALAPRLSQWLKDPDRSVAARLAAAQMGSRLPELGSALVDIIVDETAPYRLRTSLVPHLSEELPPPELDRLRLALRPGADTSDELRGQLLRRLWPGVLTLDEVLQAASAPLTMPAVLTTFKYFLTHTLPATLDVAQLAVALRWVSSLPDGGSGLHADAAHALVVAAAPHLVVAEVAAAVAPILLNESAAARYGYQDARSALAAAIQNEVARRQLLDALIAASDGNNSHLVATVQMGATDDFAWALDQALHLAREDPRRRRWIDAAGYWFRPFMEPTHLDAVTAAKDDPDVAAAFGYVFNGVAIDGPDAERARASHAQEKEWAARESAGQQAGAYRPDIVAAALESDDPDAWITVSEQLERPGGADLTVEVSRLPSWHELNAFQKLMAARTATRRTRDHLPPTPNSPGCWPLEIRHALRALWLAVESDPTVLDHFTAQQWTAWTPLLLFVISDRDTVDQRRDALLASCYQHVPVDVHSAMIADLDVEVERARVTLIAAVTGDGSEPVDIRVPGPVHTHTKLAHLWDPDLTDTLLAWQADQAEGIGLTATIPFLAAYGVAEAVTLALAALNGPDGPDATGRRVAAATGLLHTPDAAKHWPSIWDHFNTDDAFGRAIIAQIWDQSQVLNALDPTQLADLYLWIRPRLPQVGPEGFAHPMARVADATVSHLQSAATSAAIAELRRIASRHPEDPAFPYRIAEAERAHREDSWSPPLPTELRTLLDDPTRSIVTSEAGLVEAVLGSLRRAQAKISGETPAVGDLWDHPHDAEQRTPKIEPDLSDWLKRHLQGDLPPSMVNREVEITQGFRLVKKQRRVDLYVTALAPGDDLLGPRHLRVVIENKGCWNRGVHADIDTQLVHTYLAQTNCAGVYVVFCFDCHRSRSNRPCASCTSRNYEKLSTDLECLATGLSTESQIVRSFVIDAALAPSDHASSSPQ